jgi:hypothetical protein
MPRPRNGWIRLRNEESGSWRAINDAGMLVFHIPSIRFDHSGEVATPSMHVSEKISVLLVDRAAVYDRWMIRPIEKTLSSCTA